MQTQNVERVFLFMNKIVPQILGILMVSSISCSYGAVKLTETTFNIKTPPNIPPNEGTEQDKETTYASNIASETVNQVYSPLLQSITTGAMGKNEIYPSARSGSVWNAAHDGYFITESSYKSGNIGQNIENSLGLFSYTPVLNEGVTMSLSTISVTMIATTATGDYLTSSYDNKFDIYLTVYENGKEKGKIKDVGTFYQNVTDELSFDISGLNLNLQSNDTITYELSAVYTERTVHGGGTPSGSSTINLGLKSISTYGDVIPEPTSATLGLIGIGSLLLRRRRKE